MKVRSSILVASVLALVMTGCAGGPGAQKTDQGSTPPPAWTIETPPPSGGFTYFVGYADGPENGE
ncbi:MAG: hypothetical protein SNJ56_01985, partial [Termitinemataceae bacterium]